MGIDNALDSVQETLDNEMKYWGNNHYPTWTTLPAELTRARNEPKIASKTQ